MSTNTQEQQIQQQVEDTETQKRPHLKSLEILPEDKIVESPPTISEIPLGKSPHINMFWKITIPFLLIANVGMFIYCSIAVGAMVYGSGEVLHQEIPKLQVGEFSMYGSITNMWEAGVYPLALIILIFSGLWPFIKLLLMITCWFTPEKYLDFQKREKTLVILDVMGKWSLIDTYFMMIMIVAFRFYLNLIDPDNTELFDTNFSITVMPLADFYLFVIATMLSLIMTHIIIHFHRKTMESSSQNNNNNLSNIKRKFAENCSKKLRIFLLSTVILCMIFVLIGCFVKVFSFTFAGVAGFVIKDTARSTYSLWDIGYLMPHKTFDPNSFGIRLLQALFFIFTLIVPFFFLLILILFYTVPMKLKLQKTLFTISEILYAWSSIDVFAVAMVSSLFEIGQFAGFMIGDKCTEINKVIAGIAKLFPKLLDLGGDDVCFDIKTELLPGSAPLFLASILLIFIGAYNLRKIQSELEHNLELSGSRKPSAYISNKGSLENNNHQKNSKQSLKVPLIQDKSSEIESQQ